MFIFLNIGYVKNVRNLIVDNYKIDIFLIFIFVNFDYIYYFIEDFGGRKF